MRAPELRAVFQAAAAFIQIHYTKTQPPKTCAHIYHACAVQSTHERSQMFRNMLQRPPDKLSFAHQTHKVLNILLQPAHNSRTRKRRAAPAAVISARCANSRPHVSSLCNSACARSHTYVHPHMMCFIAIVHLCLRQNLKCM